MAPMAPQGSVQTDRVTAPSIPEKRKIENLTTALASAEMEKQHLLKDDTNSIFLLLESAKCYEDFQFGHIFLVFADSGQDVAATA